MLCYVHADYRCVAEQNPLHTAEVDGWERAKRFEAVFVPIPSLFGACIRTVNRVEAVLDPNDNETLKEYAVSSAEFLVRVSPSLKAVFYFAASRLYPTQLSALDTLDTKRLLLLFEPREVATIIGLTYLYRRAKRACNEKEWLILSRKIQAHMEIGYALGRRMELVGGAQGMMLGAIRFLSVATFAAIEPEKYAKFRIRHKSSTSNFDLDGEEAVFGCNHMHVAALILQSLGFTMPRSTASISLGLGALGVSDQALPREFKSRLIAWKAALNAIDLAHKSGEFMPRTKDYELRLTAADEAVLKCDIIAATKRPTFTWISKTKGDLPPDVAVQLCGPADEDSEDTILRKRGKTVRSG